MRQFKNIDQNSWSIEYSPIKYHLFEDIPIRVSEYCFYHFARRSATSDEANHNIDK